MSEEFIPAMRSSTSVAFLWVLVPTETSPTKAASTRTTMAERRGTIACMLGVLVVCSCAVFAQTRETDQSLLVVKPDVIGQQYCENYPDLDTVRLRTRITILNRSSETLIVARELPNPVRVQVSVSEEEARLGHFVYSPTAYEVEPGATTKRAPSGSEPDARQFAILPPSKQYSVIVDAVVLANLSGEATTGLATGKYWMQLRLRTWPYGMAQSHRVDRLKRKWQSKGVLITSEIESPFFQVTLPKVTHAERCGRVRSH